MSARKAYERTAVTVAKSRDGITKVLQAWGASGILWEDDLKTGSSILRFRWPHDGSELIGRVRLDVKVRSMGTSKAKEKLREQERRRLHRVAFYWLKAQHEAVEAGLFTAEVVILPWLEDASGVTLGEAFAPHLGQIASADVGRRLMLGKGS